jgi:thiamine-phosphate pyrophosphorylase
VHISLEQALSIAQEAHAGQTRRHGAPYIAHPLAVRGIVEELGDACGIEVDDATRAAALLHDVVEDSEITAVELAARFGDDVGRRVDLLTKKGKGPDAAHAYYQRLHADADDALRLTKTSDRLHNLSELHLAPDPRKLASYVDETLEHVVPLAAGCTDRSHAAGLVAALNDGMRAACRAQATALPPALAVLEEGRVPRGVYAIVAGSARLRDLIDGGVVMVQLRNKSASDRELLAMLEEMLPICRAARVPLIVNDRADLAAASNADGVHVGQGDVPPRIARHLIGQRALLGASTHTDAQLVEACASGADHVAVGPVFFSPTKVGHAPVVGRKALARRCQAASLPVAAIGGITSPARAARVGAAGAHLAAAISALDVADARMVARRMSVCFCAARAAADAAPTTKGWMT